MPGSPPHCSLYIALWPAAQIPRGIVCGIELAGEIAGDEIGQLHPTIGRREHLGMVRLQCRIFDQYHSQLYVPPHLAR